MKIFLFLVIFFFFNNCSFDNKNLVFGKRKNIMIQKESDIFKDFEKLSDENIF